MKIKKVQDIDDYIARLKVQNSDFGNLRLKTSGGNQQKAIIPNAIKPPKILNIR